MDIQVCLREMMAGAGGMVSVQTVYGIMQRLLKDEPDMSAGGAKLYLRFIMGYAHHLSEEKDQWTYKERFSEALFDHHYLQPGHDEFGIYSDIKSVLMKLDSTYQDQFRIASAKDFLVGVVSCAKTLSKELDK